MIFLPNNQKYIEWYKSLPINMKIELKVNTEILCGIKWENFIILFTPRERLNIVIKKLIITVMEYRAE